MTAPIDLRDGDTVAACSVPPLLPDTVQVWRVEIEARDWPDPTLPLVPDELEAAARFAFARDRRRFAVARAALRLLLGAHQQTPPAEIALTFGPHGKPTPLSDARGLVVYFNVAHSDGLALIAMSRNREVGIDVERIRPMPGLDEFIAQHLAPAERRALACAAPAHSLATFYRLWTLKEAYVKADGIGLRVPLNDVDVSSVGEHPTLLPRIPRSGKATSWIACSLNPGPGYAAALVVEGAAPAAVVMRDFVFPASFPERLTNMDRPHTVDASVSADG